MSSNSQFLEISRDRLFFDSYRYCMRFFFAHSGRMRSLDHAEIKNRVIWSRVHRDWMPHRKFITDLYLEQMLQFSDTVKAIDHEFKRVVFTDTQHFYTNHPEIFEAIAALPAVSQVSYSQAVVDRPRDTVILMRSNYSWRTWFRERVYDQNQAKVLANFILSRPQQFRITSGFRERLAKTWGYVSANFFVDHHDQHDTLMLNMALPGCVRKTLPIHSIE